MRHVMTLSVCALALLLPSAVAADVHGELATAQARERPEHRHRDVARQADDAEAARDVGLHRPGRHPDHQVDHAGRQAGFQIDDSGDVLVAQRGARDLGFDADQAT